MIGHFLQTLTTEQEDRVLIGKMFPGAYSAPCLVGLALGSAVAWGSQRGGCSRRWPIPLSEWNGTSDRDQASVELRFDALCARFGVRLHAAIRNRILSNRARRILQNAHVSRDTEVDAQSVGVCRFGRGE